MAAFDSRHLSYGPIGRSVEALLENRFEIPFAKLFSSGTSALIAAFASLGLKPGDEIALPDRTFIAPLNAALMLGLKPKIIPIHTELPVIDISELKAVLTPLTKAVCVVHLNGRGRSIREIADHCKANGIFLIEDSSQAFGSKFDRQLLGTFGDVATFSFGVTKAITCGQGGAVITRHSWIADRLKDFIYQGRSGLSEQHYDNPGSNFRLADPLASLLLPQLEAWENRQNAFLRLRFAYEEVFASLPRSHIRLLTADLDGDELPVWNEAWCIDRESLRTHLDSAGFSIQFLPDNLSALGFLPNDLKVESRCDLATHGVILPSGPNFLDHNRFGQLADTLKDWAHRYA